MKRNEALSQQLAKALRFHSVTGVSGRFALVEDDGAIADADLIALLPSAMVAKADAIAAAEERRHFLFRRCFQLLFVAQAVDWNAPVTALPLKHERDTRPVCPFAPEMRLSFSSSARMFLFGASERHDLGLDIERVRSIQNVVALARRFFSDDEFAVLSTAAEVQQNRYFLTLWCAKEAALKAVGRGVESGLNSFVFLGENGKWAVRVGEDPALAGPWQLSLPDWSADHIVAVMHRQAVN